MRKPPKHDHGRVAGWGFIDAENKISTEYLMQIKQALWSRAECMEEMYDAMDMPKGTICGGDVDGSSHVTEGDSGSGLVVSKFILIGVVSYRISSLSQSLAVYTDVAYFYDWVQNTAKTLYCEN
ncbi:trypsin eta-like [Choristoneura fumiferana]|uniref:trypsin eta-like n=1 Tax=Choristoneura fumiferana TaxID=7141 RepID=UPI003D154209